MAGKYRRKPKHQPPWGCTELRGESWQIIARDAALALAPEPVTGW